MYRNVATEMSHDPNGQTELARPNRPDQNGSDRNGSDCKGSDRNGQNKKSCTRQTIWMQWYATVCRKATSINGKCLEKGTEFLIDYISNESDVENAMIGDVRNSIVATCDIRHDQRQARIYQ